MREMYRWLKDFDRKEEVPSIRGLGVTIERQEREN